MATVDTPGIDTGMTINLKHSNWEQPSIIADSSSSKGMVSKKPFNIQIEKGRLMAV
ncbi:MAG: hypothetical protein NTY16_07115 [Deltaproteobacteria bacterium]|nr:hypothetical protein [Deltaproteobacteria bacterium]